MISIQPFKFRKFKFQHRYQIPNNQVQQSTIQKKMVRIYTKKRKSKMFYFEIQKMVAVEYLRQKCT